MVEQTYHEMASTIINELLCLLLAVVSTNSSIGLGSRPRDAAYNEKRYINNN